MNQEFPIENTCYRWNNHTNFKEPARRFIYRYACLDDNSATDNDVTAKPVYELCLGHRKACVWNSEELTDKHNAMCKKICVYMNSVVTKFYEISNWCNNSSWYFSQAKAKAHCNVRSRKIKTISDQWETSSWSFIRHNVYLKKEWMQFVKENVKKWNEQWGPCVD